MNSENWDITDLKKDFIKTYKMKFSNDYLFFTSNFMKELKTRFQKFKNNDDRKINFMLFYFDIFKRFRTSSKYIMGIHIKEDDKFNTLEQFKIWYKKEKEEENKIFFRAEQLAKIQDKYAYIIEEGGQYEGIIEHMKQFKDIEFRDYIQKYGCDYPEDKQNDIVYKIAIHMYKYTFEWLKRYHNGTLNVNEKYDEDQ